MNFDNLIVCSRCTGNACYVNKEAEVHVKLCFSCGFTTSDIFKKNSELHKKALETSPELYKDLEFIDESEHVWYPATLTLPEKGMVFADGTEPNNWRWAAVTAIPILEEEKDKYPEGHMYKMDMENIKHFGQLEYMDALEEIGFFNFN